MRVLIVVNACRGLLASRCHRLSHNEPEAPSPNRSSRSELLERILWRLPLPLLAFWKVGGRHHRRSAADLQRSPRFYALRLKQRVLDGASRESLCKVRHLKLQAIS